MVHTVLIYVQPVTKERIALTSGGGCLVLKSKYIYEMNYKGYN